MNKALNKTPLRSGQKNKKPWVAVSIILGVFFLLVIITICVIGFSGGFGMSKESLAMQNYLEKKYREEFEVGKAERKASGLGVEGYFQAEAKSKNSNITFTIQSSSLGFYDFYHASIWRSEQTPIVSELVSSSLPDEKIDTTVSITPSRQLQASLGGTLPTYEEVLKSSSNELTYQIRLNSEITENDYKNHVSNLQSHLLPVIEYLEQQNTGKWSLNIKANIKGGDYWYTCTIADKSQGLGTNLTSLNDCFKRIEE